MADKEEEMGEPIIKLALPTGSLENNTFELFEKADLTIVRNPRQHIAFIKELPIEIIVMRPQHIPEFVHQGICGAGICGQDCVLENESQVVEIAKLYYGRTTWGNVYKVVLFGQDNGITDLSEIPAGSKIISEYPNLTTKFFKKLGINVNINFSYGGTEAQVPNPYPFGVCITETGQSLIANNLKIIKVLCETTTVLIANQNALDTGEKAELLHALMLILTGTLDALGQVMLFMHVPVEIEYEVRKIVSGLKTPSVNKLSGLEDMLSYSVVVPIVNKDGKKINEVIIQLLKLGVTDIVQTPVGKIIKAW